MTIKIEFDVLFSKVAPVFKEHPEDVKADVLAQLDDIRNFFNSLPAKNLLTPNFYQNLYRVPADPEEKFKGHVGHIKITDNF